MFFFVKGWKICNTGDFPVRSTWCFKVLRRKVPVLEHGRHVFGGGFEGEQKENRNPFWRVPLQLLDINPRMCMSKNPVEIHTHLSRFGVVLVFFGELDPSLLDPCGGGMRR